MCTTDKQRWSLVILCGTTVCDYVGCSKTGHEILSVARLDLPAFKSSWTQHGLNSQLKE